MILKTTQEELSIHRKILKKNSFPHERVLFKYNTIFYAAYSRKRIINLFVFRLWIETNNKGFIFPKEGSQLQSSPAVRQISPRTSIPNCVTFDKSKANLKSQVKLMASVSVLTVATFNPFTNYTATKKKKPKKN